MTFGLIVRGDLGVEKVRVQEQLAQPCRPGRIRQCKSVVKTFLPLS